MDIPSSESYRNIKRWCLVSFSCRLLCQGQFCVVSVITTFCPSKLTQSLSAGLQVEDRGILVRFVEETTRFSKTPDNSEIHPALYSTASGDSIPGGKAAGAWSLPPSSAKVNKCSYTSTPPYASVACTGMDLLLVTSKNQLSFNSSSSHFPGAFMMNFLRQNLKASWIEGSIVLWSWKQTTCLSVLLNISQVPTSNSGIPWLFRIVLNIIQ